MLNLFCFLALILMTSNATAMVTINGEVSSHYISWCVYSDNTCNPSSEIECSLVPVDGSCDMNHFDKHSFILRYTNTSHINVDFFMTEDCAGNSYPLLQPTDSCIEYFDHSGTNYVFLSLVNEAVAQGVLQSNTNANSAQIAADTAKDIAIASLVLVCVLFVFTLVLTGLFCKSQRSQHVGNLGSIDSASSKKVYSKAKN
eukprot:Awhi_evm1s10721